MAKPSKAPWTHDADRDATFKKKKKNGIQVAEIPSAILGTKHQESTPVTSAELCVPGQKWK